MENSGNITQRDYIVSRATAMFIEQGIKAVRMDDIAHELAISKRTLYEMFGDKRELLEACLAYHIEQGNNYILSCIADAENVVEEMIIIIREARRNNERNRVFVHSMQKYYPDLYEPYRVRQAKTGSERFREMLRRGLEEGVFQSDINIEFTEAVFCMTLNGIVTSTKVTLPEGVTMNDAVSYIITNFFRGLSTAKGLEMVDKYNAKHKNLYTM